MLQSVQPHEIATIEPAEELFLRTHGKCKYSNLLTETDYASGGVDARKRPEISCADHKCSSIYQWNQAFGKSRGLSASGGCVRPIPARDGARNTADLRHGRARFRGRTGRRGSGTEHGRTFCDEQHRVQKKAGDGFLLSWDYFGRSSSPQNHEMTQHLARALWKHGYLDLRTTRQVYSAADDRFLPDRYVIGTCPHCGYDRARGDQCENCTRVLDPVDLINPRSALSGSARYRNPRFAASVSETVAIRAAIARMDREPPGTTGRSLSLRSRTNGWTRDCMTAASPAISHGECRCPTTSRTASSRERSSTSGSTRPSNISARPRNGPTRTRKATPGATGGLATSRGDVRYFEFMGKDNVPFHTVGFPVTIMGSDEPWKLVDRLKGFNWLNYYGGKFSTSAKRGIFMDKALEIVASRLLALLPDGECTRRIGCQFHLGTFCQRREQGPGRCARQFRQPSDQILRLALRRESAGRRNLRRGRARTSQPTLDKHTLQYDGFIWKRWNFARRWRNCARSGCWVTNISRAPRPGPHQDRSRPRRRIVRIGLNLVHLFAHLAWPVIPSSAQKIHGAVMDAPEIIPWPDEAMSEFLDGLEPGQPVNPPDVLFAKITAEQIAEWESRFGGPE